MYQTAKQQGIKARDAVEYNHTRHFGKVLTPALNVAVWYSTSANKRKPYCIAYFFADGDGKWDFETYYYRTWEELKQAHPFKFSEFDLDLRYPMRRRDKHAREG